MSDPAPGRAARARLPRLGGGELSFPLAAPLSLVVFWKSSCPTCRWSLPFVQNLYAATAGGSLRVAGVAQDSEEDARAFVADLGLSFPQAIEAGPWPLSSAHALTTVPTFLLQDEGGAVLLRSEGFSRDDLLGVVRRVAERDGMAAPDPFHGQEVPELRPG